MNEIDTFIETFVDKVQQLEGAPAALLVLLICLIFGYVLKFVKSFPNRGIPLAVILCGGPMKLVLSEFYKDQTPLRIWIVRNLVIGCCIGFVAWLLHNKILSRLEDKLGLSPGADKPDAEKPPETKVTVPESNQTTKT